MSNRGADFFYPFPELPKYDGISDVNDFLERFDAYRQFYEWESSTLPSIFALHLTGIAYTHYRYLKPAVKSDFEKVKAAFKSRFDTTLYWDKQRNAFERKQLPGENLQAFVTNLLDLCRKADFKDSDILSLLVHNIDPKYRGLLISSNPLSLEECLKTIDLIDISFGQNIPTHFYQGVNSNPDRIELDFRAENNQNALSVIGVSSCKQRKKNIQKPCPKFCNYCKRFGHLIRECHFLRKITEKRRRNYLRKLKQENILVNKPTRKRHRCRSRLSRSNKGTSQIQSSVNGQTRYISQQKKRVTFNPCIEIIAPNSKETVQRSLVTEPCTACGSLQNARPVYQSNYPVLQQDISVAALAKPHDLPTVSSFMADGDLRPSLLVTGTGYTEIHSAVTPAPVRSPSKVTQPSEQLVPKATSGNETKVDSNCTQITSDNEIYHRNRSHNRKELKPIVAVLQLFLTILVSLIGYVGRCTAYLVDIYVDLGSKLLLPYCVKPVPFKENIHVNIANKQTWDVN